MLKTVFSVGCGNGMKELTLVKSGLVEHFTLWEISPERCRIARENAEKRGLGDRVDVRQGDAFEGSTGQFDLVHWNMSLHHMPSTEEAVAWSHRLLSPGGYFYALELAGPNHYQWTDEMLEEANKVRSRIPERWLKDPTGRREFLKPKVTRPSMELMLARDPSECQDSARIEASIKTYFQDADVIHVGGVIYYLALDGCYANIGEDDRGILAEFLSKDAELADEGLWLYLACLAQKSK